MHIETFLYACQKKKYRAIEKHFKFVGEINQTRRLAAICHRIEAICKNPLKYKVKKKIQKIFITKQNFPPLFFHRLSESDTSDKKTRRQWLDDAALFGNVELVKWFCNDARGKKQLAPKLATVKKAAQSGNTELVRWLYDKTHITPDQEMLKIAASSGNVKLVQWFCRRLTPCLISLENAISSGNLALVRWLCDEKQLKPTEDMLQVAINLGNIEVVQWLRNEKQLSLSQIKLKKASYSVHLELVQWLGDVDRGKNRLALDYHLLKKAKAYRADNADLVHWLYEEAYDKKLFLPKIDSSQKMTGSDILALMQWLCDNSHADRQFIPSLGILYKAAKLGNLKLVKWLCDKNRQDKQLIPDEETLKMAVKSGNLELVKWLSDELKFIPKYTSCPSKFEKSILSTAIRSGNLALVQWLDGKIEVDVKTKPSYLFLAAASGSLELMEWLYIRQLAPGQRILEIAAGSGNFELVQWLCSTEEKLIPNIKTLENAASTGNLALLKWLFAKFSSYHNFTIAEHQQNFSGFLKAYLSMLTRAIWSGSLEVVAYLYKKISAKKEILLEAVKSGNLKVVQWFCDPARFHKRLSLNQEILFKAVDHYELLQWLCDNTSEGKELPLTQSMLSRAACLGRLETVQWLCDDARGNRKLTPDQTTLNSAILSGNLALLRWFRNECQADTSLIPDQKTLEYAALHGSLTVVKWVLEEMREEISENTLVLIAKHNNNVANFLRNYLTECAETQRNLRRDPESPTQARLIAWNSEIGFGLSQKGYLYRTKELAEDQLHAASEETKKLALKQITRAVSDTLLEYNKIWKLSKTEETKRLSYRELKIVLLEIKLNEHVDMPLEDSVEKITHFFKTSTGHWNAGQKKRDTNEYKPNKGPSIKTILMRNLLTIPLFHHKVADNILTLISHTEMQHGILYNLDLSKKNFGGCNIEGLIRFFHNECKRYAGLGLRPAQEKQTNKLIFNKCA